MNQTQHSAIVSFIWGIADDVLRDVCPRRRTPRRRHSQRRAHRILRAVRPRPATAQAFHEVARVRMQCRRDVEQFDDIDPAFSTLVFGNVRLRPIQGERKLGLCQARAAACLNQKGKEPPVVGREHRSRQLRYSGLGAQRMP